MQVSQNAVCSTHNKTNIRQRIFSAVVTKKLDLASLVNISKLATFTGYVAKPSWREFGTS